MEKEESRKWQERGGGEKQVLKKNFELQPEILINLVVTMNLQVHAVQSALNFIKIQNQKVLYTYTYA